MNITLARFWKTRGNPPFEVGDDLGRRVAVEGGVCCIPPRSTIGHCHRHDHKERLTPSTRVGVIDGRINIAQVNLAHETIDLERRT